MLFNQKHFLPSKPTFKLEIQNGIKTICHLPSAFTQLLNDVFQQDLVLLLTTTANEKSSNNPPSQPNIR